MIFRQGAGHVQPNSAADPGLVFNAGWNDWLRLPVRSQQLCTFCFGTAPAPVFDPSDYNGASIAIGDLAGTQTVTRKVTNVGSGPATYTAVVDRPVRLRLVVTPVDPHPRQGRVRSRSPSHSPARRPHSTSTPAASSPGPTAAHNVRIPLVIRPVALAAPAQVSGIGAAISYDVTFGYDGTFTATARGLVPAAITADTVADDPTDSTCSLTSPNAKLVQVTIAAGTTYARFSLFDADVNAGSDLDLCVFKSDETQVGASGSGTSAEEVNLLNPAAGDYTVVVQGWGVAGSTPFKLHTWLLGSAAAGNMTVTAPGGGHHRRHRHDQPDIHRPRGRPRSTSAPSRTPASTACPTRRSSAWTSPRPTPAGGSATGSTQREAPGDAGGLAVPVGLRSARRRVLAPADGAALGARPVVELPAAGLHHHAVPRREHLGVHHPGLGAAEAAVGEGHGLRGDDRDRGGVHAGTRGGIGNRGLDNRRRHAVTDTRRHGWHRAGRLVHGGR